MALVISKALADKARDDEHMDATAKAQAYPIG
jgi:hypothetical protein